MTNQQRQIRGLQVLAFATLLVAPALAFVAFLNFEKQTALVALLVAIEAVLFVCVRKYISGFQADDPATTESKIELIMVVHGIFQMVAWFLLLKMFICNFPITFGLILGSRPDPERPGHLRGLSVPGLLYVYQIITSDGLFVLAKACKQKYTSLQAVNRDLDGLRG